MCLTAKPRPLAGRERSRLVPPSKQTVLPHCTHSLIIHSPSPLLPLSHPLLTCRPRRKLRACPLLPSDPHSKPQSQCASLLPHPPMRAMRIASIHSCTLSRERGEHAVPPNPTAQTGIMPRLKPKLTIPFCLACFAATACYGARRASLMWAVVRARCVLPGLGCKVRFLGANEPWYRASRFSSAGV